MDDLSGLSACISFNEEMYRFRREMHELRDEMSAFRREVREEFAQVRAELKAGDEETRALMHALHQEKLAHIRVLAEGVDQTRVQLDELRATTVSKTEFEAFKADVGTFQRDVLARLADIAARVPRRRPAKRR